MTELNSSYYLGSRGRRGYANNFPFYRKGNFTAKAPLHVSCLVDGIMNALDDPSSRGVVYEAYGPEFFLMSELIDWMCHKSGRNKSVGYKRTEMFLSPFLWAKTIAIENSPLGKEKFFGPHTIERLERLQLSDEVQGLPDLRDLGVKPKRVIEKMPLEMEAHRYLAYYRPQWYDEVVVVPDPVPISRVQARSLAREQSSIQQLVGLA